MSFLKNAKVYLSGPIEFGDDKVNWRLDPKEVLAQEFQLNVFDPFDDPKQQWAPLLEEARSRNDYETMRQIAKNFIRKDLCLVDRSDFLIAYLPYKVPTTGTHHEIINSV